MKAKLTTMIGRRIVSPFLVLLVSVIFVVESFPISTFSYKANPGKNSYYSDTPNMLENTVNSVSDMSSFTQRASPELSGIKGAGQVEEEFEFDPYSDILDMNAVISEQVEYPNK